MSAVRGAGAWLLICACSACGDDEPPTTRPIDSFDGGAMDGAAVLLDANLDGSSLSDATSDDAASSEAGSAPSCSTGSLSVATVSDTFLNPLEPIALSLRNDGASLGWSGYENGSARAFTRWFGGGEVTFDLPGAGDGQLQREPAVVATATGFLSVSSDGPAGSAQLRARRTSVVGEQVDLEPTSLTSDAADNHTPVLALGADGNVVVVWTVSKPRAQGKVAVLSPDGNALAGVVDVPDLGTSVGRPALSAMGSGFLLAWVDATARHVHVQRLDAGGAPVGASSQIDAEGNARGHLDLAFTDQGGALAFDVLVDGARPEIRVRTFALSGIASGNEHSLTPFPDTGRWPALIAVRGGYVLAYRSAQLAEQQLRLALLDGRGFATRAASVAHLASVDLPLVMRASPDGEAVFLSWFDGLTDSNGHQLQRTWIHCD